MSLNDTIRFPRGDTQILPFSVQENNTNFDLTGASLDWRLYDGDNEVLSSSNDGVEIQNREDLNGNFEVKIKAGATDNLPVGGYTEQIRVIDDSGARSTFLGELRLQPAKG